jgi:luciferase family oxidoreductase group 1
MSVQTPEWEALQQAEKPGRCVQFSVLDQAPVAEGFSAGESLARSVELAQHVESLGYRRFWMSEHHAMQTLACSAPEVVLSRVGAATSRIRIGSGGIMLPHYAPLKVAENFMTLAAMYPGRVDLGIGRAPGGGPVESQALRRDRRGMPPDDFAEQMAELLAWLGQGEGFPATHPFSRIRVSPALEEDDPGPAVWLLGSSMWGAAAAAQWGLPYAFAHFFSPMATRAALESYRRGFVPRNSEDPGAIASPQVVAAVGVIVAPTDEEAQFLHSSVRLLQKRIRQGDRSPVATPERAIRILQVEFGEGADGSQSGFRLGSGASEEGEFPRYIVGSPGKVRREVSAMASSLGLDELVINTITHDHAARLRSYSLLAEAFAQDATASAIMASSAVNAVAS